MAISPFLQVRVSSPSGGKRPLPLLFSLRTTPLLAFFLFFPFPRRWIRLGGHPPKTPYNQSLFVVASLGWPRHSCRGSFFPTCLPPSHQSSPLPFVTKRRSVFPSSFLCGTFENRCYPSSPSDYVKSCWQGFFFYAQNPNIVPLLDRAPFGVRW